MDERVKNCWLGHPYLYMIDNSTAFQPKIDRVFQAVCKFIGLDVDIEKRKYLVTSCPDVFPVSFTDSIVEHHYITTVFYLFFVSYIVDGWISSSIEKTWNWE